MTLHDVTEFVRLYVPTIALVATWTVLALVWLQQRRAWDRKSFLSLVNFSLNYIQEGGLAMRTLLELPAESVWLNEHGCRLIADASRKTTLDDPLIRLRHPKDQAFIHRAVLNALSPRCAEGYMAAALGLPVARGQFVVGITCEKYADIRTLKVRVLLIQESTLDDLFGPLRRAEALALSDPVLRDRMRTLGQLHRHWLEDQARPDPVLGRIELVLPKP